MQELEKYEYMSYWPAEGEVRLLHGEEGLSIGIQEAGEIEPGAYLLVWAANDLDSLAIELEKLLPATPRPLYCKLPGPEGQVRVTASVLEKLGFALGDFNLDMRLDPIPVAEMPPDVSYGPGQDFRVLAAIEAAVFPRYRQSAEELRAKAASAEGLVLSITVGGVPAGVLTGSLYGENNSSLFMRSLAVLPQCRGRGLARKLIQAFLALGRKRGAVRSMLWLGDLHHNLPARKLYSSFGYRGMDVEAELVLKE